LLSVPLIVIRDHDDRDPSGSERSLISHIPKLLTNRVPLIVTGTHAGSIINGIRKSKQISKSFTGA
jgi:hypothetical protein